MEPTGGNASKKSVFTTWWFSNAFPFSRDYVVVENVPRSAGKYFFYAGAAILLFTTRTAFPAGLHPVTGEIPAPTELLKNALAAPLVGVVTAAAFAAAPLAGAVSAAGASALLGAATPWASSVASLVCVSTVPATLATLGVLRVLHYLLADGCVGGSDAAASCATLAGVASTFFFLAGYAVLKGLGGAYVFAVFAVFLGGFLVFEVLRGRKRARPTATGGGGGDDGLRFPSLAKIALALAVPLYVASPVVVTLVSLLFGMTGRSLVGRDAGGGEHAYGAVTGAACGAAAIFLSPMLVHSKKNVASKRARRESRDRSLRRDRGDVVDLALGYERRRVERYEAVTGRDDDGRPGRDRDVVHAVRKGGAGGGGVGAAGGARVAQARSPIHTGPHTTASAW